MRKLTGIAVIASIVSAVLLHGVAQAQYPPPLGAVQAQSSAISSGVQSNLTLTCVATGPNGGPQAGVPCTINVDSEPGGAGGDVAVGSKTITKVTDATGRATTNLYTGSYPGVIQISMSTPQGLASRVLVQVIGAPAGASASAGAGSTASTSVRPAAPPAAPLDQGPSAFIVPPATGDAGLVGTSSGSGSAVLFAAVLTAVIAGSLAVRSFRTNGI